jgi:hypothetical protein
MEFAYFRFYVKTRYLLGVKAIDIFNELNSAYDSQAPSYAFVLKCTGLFKDVREEVKDDPRSGRPRTNNYEPKTMFSIFFKTSGAVYISYMDKGKTINAESYINDCIKPMFKEVIKQRPSCGLAKIKFHHDNAKPHVAKIVVAYLNELNIGIIEHPPYSPDLAPSDF